MWFEERCNEKNIRSMFPRNTRVYEFELPINKLWRDIDFECLEGEGGRVLYRLERRLNFIWILNIGDASKIIFEWGIYLWFMPDRIFSMDVLLNGFSISAKAELQSLYCMMGKTRSLRCHLLAANSWRLIYWIQNKIKLST